MGGRYNWIFVTIFGKGKNEVDSSHILTPLIKTYIYEVTKGMQSGVESDVGEKCLDLTHWGKMFETCEKWK